MRLFAADSEFLVRLAVASNPCTLPDDLIEYCVAIGDWDDPMSYSSSAETSAKMIIAAAKKRRKKDQFGAADAVLCLVAAHPRTPPTVRQLLQQDSDETVRTVAAQL